MDFQPLLLQCRPGFEGDCAAEITELAAAHGVGGYCRTQPNQGYVLFQPQQADGATLLSELPFARLVFTRQWFQMLAELRDLPEADRAGPIAAAVRAQLPRIGGLWLEYPDTNEGKSLSGFCRKFEPALQRALDAAGVRRADGGPRLHLFLLDSRHLFIGAAPPDNSAPWPMGIPRLKMPAQAPSRSTLKLDEALQIFVPKAAQAKRLAPGMRAVDLGASPGGWTWQLARRGLLVTAIDNGPMAESVMATGLVEHLRADGFVYRPPRPVDWLVCDMVENPLRVAALVGDWLAAGLCREAVFNLKLPMKKRYQAVKDCLDGIRRRLEQAGLRYELQCKQLYHDREEVTGHARRL